MKKIILNSVIEVLFSFFYKQENKVSLSIGYPVNLASVSEHK